MPALSLHRRLADKLAKPRLRRVGQILQKPAQLSVMSHLYTFQQTFANR